MKVAILSVLLLASCGSSVPAYKLDALRAHCEDAGGVGELYVNPKGMDLEVICVDGTRTRYDQINSRT